MQRIQNYGAKLVLGQNQIWEQWIGIGRTALAADKTKNKIQNANIGLQMHKMRGTWLSKELAGKMSWNNSHP